MNPYENLDSLFKQARQSFPLLDKEDVQKIIEEPKPIVRTKTIFGTKTFIIGTAATLVICGAVYFIYPKEEIPKQVAQQNIIVIDSAKNNTSQSSKIVEKTPLNISSEKKIDIKKTAQTSVDSDTALYQTSTTSTSQVAQIKNEESPIYPNTSIGNYSKRVDEEKNTTGYFHLTNEELAELGIITDGFALRYLNRSDTSKINDYDNRKSILAFAYNIDIEKHGSMRINNTHKDDSLLEKSSNPNIPLLISITEMKSKKENWIVGNGKLSQDLKDKYIEEIKPKLVPIVINLKGKPSLYSHDNDVVFWYKNNQTLRNSLPHELSTELKKSYPDFDENAYQTYLKNISTTSKVTAKKNAVSKEEKENIKSKMLFLSNSELKKLGIRFNGKKLVCKQSGLSSNGKYFGLELILSPDLFLINISDNLLHQSGVSPKNLWYCSDSSFNIIHDFTDNLSEQNGKKYFDYMRAKNTLFKNRIDSMIPVFISFDEKAIKKSKDKDPLKSQVLWFSKNETVIKKLPERYRILFDEEQPPANFFTPKIDMTSIKLIELSDEDLAKISVFKRGGCVDVRQNLLVAHYSKDGASFDFKNFTPLSFPKTSDTTATKSGEINFKFKIASDDRKKVDSSVSKIPNPVLITDDLGVNWRSYTLDYTINDEDIAYMKEHHLNPGSYDKIKKTKEDAEKKLIEKLKIFIPILVKTGYTYTKDDKAKHKLRPDLILWYEPTDSFFALLPKNIANEIKAEYTAIKANQPTPSCKYFETCKSIKGMINDFSAFPNPTNNELNIQIDLAEERKLTISLTDISGKVVKNFVKDILQQPCKKEYPVQIGEVSEGMYLLLIETDKGERVTQRIIKK